jgi:hypothetical protein
MGFRAGGGAADTDADGDAETDGGGSLEGVVGVALGEVAAGLVSVIGAAG